MTDWLAFAILFIIVYAALNPEKFGAWLKIVMTGFNS